MVNIVVAGELIAEFVATDRGQGLENPGNFQGPFPSGAPAIFADQAAQLGVSVTYIGYVGQDAFGNAIIQRLKSHNINTQHIHQVDRPTALAFVAYKEDGSREFVFSINGSATSLLGAKDISSDLFEGCQYFHVMGSSLNSEDAIATIQQGMKEALAVGANISFDPNVRAEMLAFTPMRDALHQVLNACSVFLPSEADLSVFFPDLSPEDAVQEILKTKPNIRCIVLKRGAKGSEFFNRQHHFVMPGYKATEIDPTGAGDCFGGTFIASLIQGVPPKEALSRANAAGALAVTKVGPMEGNSSLDEINQFLKQQDRALS